MHFTRTHQMPPTPFWKNTEKLPFLILGFFLLLILLFWVRSCITNHSEILFHIGQDSRWPGLGLMGRERNLTAFNQELLEEIAKAENFTVRMENSHASNLLSDLEKGVLQGALTIVEPNYMHEDGLIFSDPYFFTGPVLIIPLSAPSHNEKRKKIIGIAAYSPFLLSLEKDSTIQTKIYGDILSALSDLRGGTIDGAIFPAIPAYTYVNTFYKHELKIASTPLTQEGIRLAALKNEKGKFLIEHFNQGLAAIKASGAYDKLLKEWDFFDVEKIE